MYGEGVNKLGELIDIGAEQNIVEKSGAWFSYGGTRIGQGRDNAREYLRNNPETAARIEAEIRMRQTAALQPLLNGPASSTAPSAAKDTGKDDKKPNGVKAAKNAEA
jgi:recombination protein RecA